MDAITPGIYQQRDGGIAYVLTPNDVEGSLYVWIGRSARGLPESWMADGRANHNVKTKNDLVARIGDLPQAEQPASQNRLAIPHTTGRVLIEHTDGTWKLYQL
jgi:hypothetical protein